VPASPLPAPRPVCSGMRLSRCTSIWKDGRPGAGGHESTNAFHACWTVLPRTRSGLLDERRNPGVSESDVSTMRRSPSAIGRNRDSSPCSVEPFSFGSTRSQALILVRVSTVRRIASSRWSVLLGCSYSEYSHDQTRYHLLTRATVGVGSLRDEPGNAVRKRETERLTWPPQIDSIILVYCLTFVDVRMGWP